MKKVSESTLRRVVSRLHRLEPGREAGGASCWAPEECDEINVTINPFSIIEEVHAAQELLKLRELAEKMAVALEESGNRDTYEASLQYREEYPK